MHLYVFDDICERWVITLFVSVRSLWLKKGKERGGERERVRKREENERERKREKE